MLRAPPPPSFRRTKVVGWRTKHRETEGQSLDVFHLRDRLVDDCREHVESLIRIKDERSDGVLTA